MTLTPILSYIITPILNYIKTFKNYELCFFPTSYLTQFRSDNLISMDFELSSTPACNHMFKVNNKVNNTRARCEICSK